MFLRSMVALLIASHGFVYLLYFIPNSDKNWPFTFNKGIMSSRSGFSNVAKILIASAVILFVITALVLLFAPAQVAIWQVALVSAAVLALIVQLAYWQNQLVIGVIINVAFLYLVFFTEWLEQWG
jgi:hypothetical protein